MALQLGMPRRRPLALPICRPGPPGTWPRFPARTGDCAQEEIDAHWAEVAVAFERDINGYRCFEGRDLDGRTGNFRTPVYTWRELPEPPLPSGRRGA